MKTLNIFYKRFMKAIIAIAVCAVMVLGTAYPAMAFGGSSSNSSKGSVEMNDLKETSKEAVRKEPRSAQAVQAKAKEGPNSVQGSANSEKMKNTGNSDNATTIKAQVEDVLEKATPGS